MDYKILLADDSPTIQKVVKITLASEPYKVEECTEAAQLINKLNEVSPHIVLLDFNLSEDKTGYQLAQEIYEQSPQTKIMMLFGTFDTIDDDQLKASHVSAKIVKPFDGTKFINTCRSLIDEISDNSDTLISSSFDELAEDEFPEVIEEESEEEVTSFSDIQDDDDEWVVNQPDVIEEEEAPLDQVKEDKALSALEKEALDWGASVPGVIGNEEEESFDIPDIISNEADGFIMSSEGQKEVYEEASFPDDDDLDYPDMIEVSEKIEEEETQEASSEEPFISMDEMEDADKVNGTTSEEDIEKLQAQIADETEDDDIWSADEVEETSFSSEEAVEDFSTEDFPEKINDDLSQEEFIEEEIFSHDDDEDDYDMDRTLEEQLDDDFPETTPHTLTAVTEDYRPELRSPKVEITQEMTEELFEKIRPIIEEEIKKYCKEMVEKVAWEVIPDLAENLIKKQIEKITDDILNSD